jgi:hypothetical protein
MRRAPDAVNNVCVRNTERGARAETVPFSRGKEKEVSSKIAMMIAMAVVLLALGASAVFAQNQVVRCHGKPCYATGNHDLVYERRGNGLNDLIYLRGGNDQVRAQRWSSDRDVIRGSRGFDLIYVNDGDRRDKIWGGRGNDKCYVDARREVGSGCSRVIVR